LLPLLVSQIILMAAHSLLCEMINKTAGPGGQNRPCILFMALLLLLICPVIYAQENDTLNVHFSDSVLVQGDTLHFEITLKNNLRVSRAATIHLWVDDIASGKRWKYRYPLVNGEVSANLIIDATMASGVYAFNFQLQKNFYKIFGRVKNIDKDERVLNYIMIARNKQTLVSRVVIDEKQSFSIGPLLFQDSAFIIFSRPKQKNADLQIDIETPLDSAFESATNYTCFLQVGRVRAGATNMTKALNDYHFQADSTPYKIILPEVMVAGAVNKKLAQFEKEYVSGMFSSTDALVLDGLGSDEMSNAADLYTFLSVKVGGLRVDTDEQTGDRFFTWRNQTTDIYINEIRLDPELPVAINPSDIAMIKIFKPGTAIGAGSSAGGAIAIYTKTAAYKKTNNRNYSFYIVGYTALESLWK
jgi:hypothetical protein